MKAVSSTRRCLEIPGHTSQDDPVIQCNPQGICSSDYYLDGDGHSASIEFQWASDAGRITVDGRHFEIRKEGFFNPVWTLYLGAQAIYGARRISMFSRAMVIEGADSLCELQPHSLFGRSMQLAGGSCNCLIRPMHAFTRRATIEGQWREFTTVAFGFWLTAMIWRRRQRSSSSAGGGGGA